MRLTFMLPPQLGLVAPNTYPPSADGCRLIVDAAGLVHVTGPTRLQIFDHVTRFLRSIGRKRVPTVITAVLNSPPGYWPGHGGRDTWSIAVDADVVFAPTGQGLELPTPEGNC